MGLTRDLGPSKLTTGYGSSVLGKYDTGKRQYFRSNLAMDVLKLFSDGRPHGNGNFRRFCSVDDAYIPRSYAESCYGSFYNVKKIPGNENLALEWVSYLIGKRESRRLVGDYIYTFNDEREMREFPDAVAMEERDIDVHYQQKIRDPDQPDFLSEALFYKVDHYYIPYRSLYSRNISNLFMAGRCFSCSHVGLGGPRVMHTTGQMGVAVGYAASLCKKYSTTPRVFTKTI